jgi:hypothetical protein
MSGSSIGATRFFCRVNFWQGASLFSPKSLIFLAQENRGDLISDMAKLF